MFTASVLAQGTSPVFKLCPKSINNTQYLDSVFFKGSIVIPDGSHFVSYFNYNRITNCLVFLNDDNQICVLPKIAGFTKVSYGNRSFIPISSNAIAEVVREFDDGTMLLQEYKSLARNTQRGAYGTTTETSSITVVTHYDDRGKVLIPLSVIVENEYRFLNRFYVKIGDSIEPLTSRRKIKKLFPARAHAIELEFDRIIDNEPEVNRYIRIISAAVGC